MTIIYGSVDAPYPEQPYYSRTKEVHWSGIYGVLTVTYLESSYEDLTPSNSATIGPYVPGESIPWSAWKGTNTVLTHFSDHSPIDIVEQLPDTSSSPTGFTVEACCIPAAPSHSGIPSTGSGEDYFQQITASYEGLKAISDQVVANMTFSQSVNPGSTLTAEFDLTATYYDNAANGTQGAIIDRTAGGPGPGWTKASASFSPIGAQYQVYHWDTGEFPFPPPPTPGVAGTSMQAYSNINPFEDALSSAWAVLKLYPAGGGGGPGDKLASFRHVYLIDFQQLAKDGSTEVVVAQGWGDVPTEFSIPSYDNTYRLELYGSADGFVAGAQQTVTLKAGLPPHMKTYDQIKSVAWNDGSQVSHPILKFDHRGWVATSTPTTGLLIEARL